MWQFTYRIVWGEITIEGVMLPNLSFLSFLKIFLDHKKVF